MKNVLDEFGFVDLKGSMADDLDVVNSARVSFGKKADELGEAEIGLINFLMKNRHGTPFEHNAFKFHVKCPIFVAREWFRHRIGSFNEFSARYSHMPTEGYVPEYIRKQTGKPGSYTFEPAEYPLATHAQSVIEKAYRVSYDTYNELVRLGVAKEVARTVLPMGTYTEFYWTVNARSLMNFLNLRTSEHAQWEIRQYAYAIEDIFEAQMPVTHAAWVANGKQAP